MTADPLHPFGRTHADPSRCCCRHYPPARHHPECPRPDAADVCWHCRALLAPEPLPHCEHCPAFDDCDVLDCDAPGCAGGEGDLSGEALADLQAQAARVETDLRETNARLRALLARVIDDETDPAALRALARDIAVELCEPLDPAAAPGEN